MKSILWYGMATLLPMFFNFIKTPIFTRIFSAEDFGNVAIIDTTFSYINIITFAALSSSVWRFYHKYSEKNELHKFRMNINSMIIFCIIVNFILCLIWVLFEPKFINRFMIIINSLSNIIMQVISINVIFGRMEGKIKLYALTKIGASIISMLIICIVVFKFKLGIESFYIGALISELIIFGLYLSRDRYILKILNLKYINISIVKEIFIYGISATIISISSIILVSSDRYIIDYFLGKNYLGIYNQVYIISQASIMAIITVFFNIINPNLLKSFQNSNNEIAKKYIEIFVIIFLPLTLYFSIFSKEISSILLGEEFRVGYEIMPYIMISSFFQGINQIYSTKLKFENKMKDIIFITVLAGSINILLNYIFIPLGGYKIAAITTALSYILIFLFYQFKLKSIELLDSKNFKLYVIIIVLISIQGLIKIILNRVGVNEILDMICLGIGFVIIYVVIILKKFNIKKYIVNNP